MPVVGVADAAAELAVSERRVRQMLADGVLVGQRVGRAWVVDSEQLRVVGQRRPQVGRPWGPASAWAVLALADGKQTELSPVARSRAKNRLADGLAAVARRLDARANERWFYAHPGVLDRLGDASQVVVGGARAAVEHGADLVVGQELEGYVRVQDLAGLVQQFGLEGNADRPNVLLRVVDDDVWPFEGGQAFVSRAIAAVDLLGSAEPRSRRAGAEMLASS